MPPHHIGSVRPDYNRPVQEFDAIVIGGGPAGSIAALFLAQAGRRVALLEQRCFPRNKVCGECLSSNGIDVLTRLGVAERIRKLGAVSLRRTILHASGGETASLDLPREMWGISRRAMDVELLDAARDAGATVLQPMRCQRIVAGPEPIVHAVDLPSRHTVELRARWIIVADGKAALLGNVPAATTDFGVKRHWRGVDAPGDAVELFGMDGHYGGLAPIEGSRWNTAFSVPQPLLAAHRGDLDALFAQMVESSAGLGQRMRHASPDGPWLTSPLPRFAVQPHWADHVIPIGNAAAALEPIGGEGMGLAMRSGEMAAIAVDEAIAAAGEVNVVRLRRAFRRLWRTRAAGYRALAVMMSQRTTARLITQAASLLAPVASHIVRTLKTI